MSETVKYLATCTQRQMMKSGQRATIHAGEIVTGITDAALADALERGWIVKRTMREGVLVDLDAKQEPEKAPEPTGKNPATRAAQTNEGLELDGLKGLDADALVTACAERALPSDAAQDLVEFLRGQEDPKAASLEYLGADFADRKELCENLIALAAEKRAAAEDMQKAKAASDDATADPGADKGDGKKRDTVVVDGEEVERPKNMMGDDPHAKKE